MRRNPTFSSSSPWFHGSAAVEHWESALRLGTATLASGHSKFASKKWLAPSKGMVYLTPRAMTALDYAAERHGQKIGGRSGGWSGVVLKVHIPDGTIVTIDEDCLGAAIVAAEQGRRFVAPMTCGYGMADLVIENWKLVRELKSVVSSLTAAQQRWIYEGYDLSISKLATIGKKAQRLVSDEAQLALLKTGANIAVKPPVEVIGGWVVSPPQRWVGEMAGDPYGQEPSEYYERAATELLTNSAYSLWIPNVERSTNT